MRYASVGGGSSLRPSLAHFNNSTMFHYKFGLKTELKFIDSAKAATAMMACRFCFLSPRLVIPYLPSNETHDLPFSSVSSAIAQVRSSVIDATPCFNTQTVIMLCSYSSIYLRSSGWMRDASSLLYSIRPVSS